MNPYEWLATPAGEALLAELGGFTEARAAAAAAFARKRTDASRAAAALTTAFARRRAVAAGKFSRADKMFFTHAGYEQASSEALARHRAARFANHARVVDLCSGIGSDSIALAAALGTSGRVDGVDMDEDALACARHNAQIYDVQATAIFHQADALAWALGADAAFADPSRRSARGRARHGDEYQPPLPAILARAKEIPDHAMGVKIAPGLRVDEDGLRELCGAPVELEYLSERGECKEAAVWCGALARRHGARSATVIDAGGTHVLDGAPLPAMVRSLERYLGEPDPAVIRAGLIGTLCERVGAAVLDPDVAYVTAERADDDPYVRWYEVIEALPFGVKRLRALLRARGIGSLVIKTRAFPMRPDEIAAALKLRGDEAAVLACTTIGGVKTAIVCRAPSPPLPN
ncbi:MAG TPA: class I SAM-dependent methyltransferase [Candidatus Eremiobacteraceae bacterium]|nr:class I SAM-dependent methyltransferase [Candidatus Eremiobacteraceae bacterium]